MKLARTKKLSQPTRGESEDVFRQKERSVLKTVALMQSGFTVTLGENKLQQIVPRKTSVLLMLCCELVAIYDNANLLKLSPNCKFSVAKYISVFLLQL